MMGVGLQMEQGNEKEKEQSLFPGKSALTCLHKNVGAEQQEARLCPCCPADPKCKAVPINLTGRV